jgi:galactokinase
MNDQLDQAIHTLYSTDHDQQRERYRRALALFRERFGYTDQIHIIRAPGRVNLIGEHTDYNHGYVMPAALDRDVLILARPRPDQIIHMQNGESGFPPVTFTAALTVPPAPRGDWSNYARGAVQVFSRHMNSAPPGMDLLVFSAAPHGVPRGAGLSSSTAFTVAVAFTLCNLAEWALGPEEIIRLCSDSEWYVGTRGGIMDQFASVFGVRDHALFLDCRPATGGYYRYQSLPLPQQTRLLIVDSGVHHDNARGEFNQRVAACRAGVGLLRQHHPHITHLRDVQALPWSELSDLLPEITTAKELARQNILLGELPGLDTDAPLRVRACCRHVWTENQRVFRAVDALEGGNMVELGALMNEAHTSARDDYLISCPELEILVNSARDVDGVYGARLTGAGWGGCMIALVHQDAIAQFRSHVAGVYTHQTGRTAAIFPCQAGAGAGLTGIFSLSQP